MRTIKFRGKRCGDNAWVCGCLYQGTKEGQIYSIILDDGGYSLAPPNDIGFAIAFAEDEVNVVFPETVGQYTGLRDKNGKEIYEGDILLLLANAKVNDYEKGEFVDTKFKRYFVVAWAKQCQGFGLCLPDEAHIDSPDVGAMSAADRMYIVGNIHDNTELL